MDIKELKSFTLADAVKFHDKLNPKLWFGDKLLPTAKKQLMTIAQDFIAFMGISDLNIEDITISGSNAAYSYTPHSDIDLHILVDFKKLPEDEVYKELFGAKKTLYNEKHDITVHKVPVELYVQDINQPHTSLGEYSLLNDKWIKIPKKRRANFDERATKAKYEKLGELVELALKSSDLEKITHVLDIIGRYRKAGLSKAGEFGPENIAYKAIRAQGLIQKLYDKKSELHSKSISTENMYEQRDRDHYLGRLAKAASDQRGEPEIVMVQAQRALGGGVLSFVLEHVGDIYNRMHNTGYGELDDYNSIEERRYVVLDKIEKTLRTLTRKYGFEREHKENLESNARFAAEYEGKSPEDYQKEVEIALKRYALAHAKLPVYNRLQKLARTASIALGDGDFNRAVIYLSSLKDIAENEKLWHEEINKFSENVTEIELDEATRRGFLQGLGALGATAISADAEAGKYIDGISRIIDRESGSEFWDKQKFKLEYRADSILNKLLAVANEARKKRNLPPISKPTLKVGNEVALAAIEGSIKNSTLYLDVTVFYDLSDDSLAATIAHEIGHIAYVHRGYTKNAEANKMMEKQADVFGIRLMMEAGYDPSHALKDIEDQGKDFSDKETNTHPSLNNRKKHINDALKKEIFHLTSAIRNYEANVQYLASLKQQSDIRLAENNRKKVKKEDYHPNDKPPGPEFKPTMPKGTVRVDVSDVYDWYKLGQHISNLKGLGKHDFGKGPPSTIMSFGDEDLEHEYIADLEKTGLTTTDIDPVDPKQPKGMKRQKVDPTYNVKEAATYKQYKDFVWYHGTSLKNYEQILKSKKVKPFVADDDEPGAAIWLASDIRDARDFGPVILAINNEDAAKFKRNIVGTKHSATMVIKQAVPLRFFRVVYVPQGIKYKQGAKIQKTELTFAEILKAVKKNVPYDFDYKGITDYYVSKKTYETPGTRKEMDQVIKLAKYLKKNPQILATLPPINVVNNTLYDGTRLLLALNLIQTKLDPANPFWKNAKIKVNFANFADLSPKHIKNLTTVAESSDILLSDNKPKLVGLSYSELEKLSENVDETPNVPRKSISINFRTFKNKGTARHSFVVTRNGETIAYGEVQKDNDQDNDRGASVEEIVVVPKFRRKGIASKIYDAIEKEFNYKLHPSDDVTDAGQKFWQSRKNFYEAFSTSVKTPKVTFRTKKQKNKFATELLYNGKLAGTYQYDSDTGRSIAELYPEYRGQGLGKLLVLHAIYTAAKLGLHFQEDESRTAAYDQVLDNLSDSGYIVSDEGNWYVTDLGEKYLKQTLKESSGYIPSEREKNDPRFKTALTVDVKPDSIKKNAKAFGWKINRAGVPPLLRK